MSCTYCPVLRQPASHPACPPILAAFGHRSPYRQADTKSSDVPVPIRATGAVDQLSFDHRGASNAIICFAWCAGRCTSSRSPVAGHIPEPYIGRIDSRAHAATSPGQRHMLHYRLARITLHATSRRSPRSTVAAPKRSSTAQIQ
ncbi:hypothetical protein OH76DRAFT_1155568 [Lentinus brumalis]|uniref:Uncharacterized protein n=1 Tax=Lentinus brumalis TaxID=2498619 RepID=A0A371DMT7_9APHY|nr:hypothetical protein OH76DRAFT_1155568 [Polyporus brumalis]